MGFRILGPMAVWIGLATLIATVFVTDQMIGRPTALIDRWFFAVAGLAVMVFGMCAKRSAAAFGILAFFLIVGGAAQLYVSGPAWLPTFHLIPHNWKEWATVSVLMAEALVAVTVLATLGAERIWAQTQARLGFGRILLFVLVTGLLSVPLIMYLHDDSGVAYLAHVMIGILVTMVHFTVFAAMSQVKSPISGLYRLSPLVPATVTLIVSLILCFFAFERMPHTIEEMAYLFQAKTFAGGALVAPAPPQAALAAFEYPMIEIKDGQWYSATNPGWSVALALGVLAGGPWLINPLLAGLSVLLAHGIASRLAGRDQADMVAMMMGAAPWALAMAASLMPHTLVLFLMLFAWWMILRAGEQAQGALRRLFIAGLAMGWVFATRPLDGLVVGGLTGLWLLAIAPMGGVGRALIYGLGCVGSGGMLLVYNARMTGSMLVQPVQVYFDRVWGIGANGFGFGETIGAPASMGRLDLWPGHSPLEALLNTINLTANLQLDFMGWSVGSLALILCYLLWQRPSRADIAMMVVIAAIVGAVMLYWSADSYYIGPRHWFLALFPLCYLSARGFQAIRQRFPDQDELAFVRIDSLFWYACLFGLCVFLPWRAVTKYYEFDNFHPSVREAVADGTFEGKLVLVTQAGDPASVLMLNDPWLRGTVYLNDTGTLDEAALSAALGGRGVEHLALDWTGK